MGKKIIVAGGGRLEGVVERGILLDGGGISGCIICIKNEYMQWEIFSYVSSETLCSQK